MLCYTGFSHTGSLHSAPTFASHLPDNVPIVLIFGAQATKGICAADHPYVRLILLVACKCFFVVVEDSSMITFCTLIFFADSRNGVDIRVPTQWCGGY